MAFAFEGDKRVHAGDAAEGQATAFIESYTSQVPSGIFLTAALASITASLVFKSIKKDHAALFVGQWVAPLLILGLYNKLVKQHGSDAENRSYAVPYPSIHKASMPRPGMLAFVCPGALRQSTGLQTCRECREISRSRNRPCRVTCPASCPPTNFRR